jgi:hypothetical protein
MAEDLRRRRADEPVSIPDRSIVDECQRQEESCLHSAVTLFEYLKAMRLWRNVFVIAPIIASALATSALIAKDFYPITGILVLIAGVFPAIYKALKFDVSLELLSKSANKFKELQDRFRQLRLVGHDDPSKHLTKLMDQLDDARMNAPVAPEKYFEKACEKIAKGHYKFEVDQATKPI